MLNITQKENIRVLQEKWYKKCLSLFIANLFLSKKWTQMGIVRCKLNITQNEGKCTRSFQGYWYKKHVPDYRDNIIILRPCTYSNLNVILSFVLLPHFSALWKHTNRIPKRFDPVFTIYNVFCTNNRWKC